MYRLDINGTRFFENGIWSVKYIYRILKNILSKALEEEINVIVFLFYIGFENTISLNYYNIM